MLIATAFNCQAGGGLQYASSFCLHLCRKKDESTTQSSVGCRICGVLVHNTRTGDTWRADKHWGKTLTHTNIPEAFLRFADNGELRTRCWPAITPPGVFANYLAGVPACLLT